MPHFNHAFLVTLEQNFEHKAQEKLKSLYLIVLNAYPMFAIQDH